jgi:hypothetical protein
VASGPPDPNRPTLIRWPGCADNGSQVRGTRVVDLRSSGQRAPRPQRTTDPWAPRVSATTHPEPTCHVLASARPRARPPDLIVAVDRGSYGWQDPIPLRVVFF